MDKSSFQRIVDEIVSKTSLDKVKAELSKVREDISSLSNHPQARRARKEAEKRSKKLVSLLNEAQKQFDKEVEKATTKLWQSTSDIDSMIKGYRKKAADEFARLEKLVGIRIKGMSTGSSTTSKKSASTSSKKASSAKKKATSAKKTAAKKVTAKKKTAKKKTAKKTAKKSK